MTKSVRDAMPGKADSKAATKGDGPGAEPPSDVAPRDAATQSFIRGILARGEAGHYDPDGKLPLAYKYAVIGTHADGLPILERVRT